MKNYLNLLVYLFAAMAVSVSSCTKDITTAESKVAELKYSPYITKVFDYLYGPGQHAPLISSSEKANDFIGEPWTNNKSYTSLGGWGGYIVAGF